MRKTSLIFLGALVGVVATLLLTQPHTLLMGSAAGAAASDTYRTLNLFGDVFEVVRSAYVEKPEDSKLVESAINGMLAGLDPHSGYMNPHSLRDMQVQTRGEFGGLGIEVTMEDGLIKVIAPIDDTPAAKAGVMANDIITQLDDNAVQGLTIDQAVDKMRGPVNTKIEVTIVRDIIRVKSVRSSSGRRRRRLHSRDAIQRTDDRRSQAGDQRSQRQARRRQDQRLRSRSAQQSGRL